MNQALRAGRIITDNEQKIKKILDEVGDTVKNIPLTSTPVENGEIVYRKIRQITGIFDPYKKIKQKSIQEAKQMYPSLKKIIQQSSEPLETAIRIAIAGNVIDFAIDRKYDLKNDVNKILKQDFAFFDYQKFKNDLSNAKYVLYIGDNAGESVFDKLLIETIAKKTYYAVREIPVINDVVKQDAIDSGLSEVSEIISSGCNAPGAILNRCNDDFLSLFEKAPLIISKGQGNYEGLSDENRSIYFLLKAKCKIIAKDINVPKDSIILKNSGN